MGPARAANIDFPPSPFDRDSANILDQRFGAIARTSGCRELQLRRAVDTAEPGLDFLREAHAITKAKATVVGADTALAGAIAFSPGPASGHVEFCPHRGKLILRHADEIDALTASHL